MKRKSFKLILVFVLAIFLVTCDDENIQENKLENYTLNKDGNFFVKCLKTNSSWQKEWQKVCSRGTPLINNAVINYTTQYNIHYLLPILSTDNVVKQFAIFPMEEAKVKTEVNATLKKPIFLTCDDGKEAIRNVIDSDVAMILLEAGITFDESFIPSETNLDSRVMRYEGRTYKIRYRRNGTPTSPWSEDRSFLIQFLQECEKIVQNWSGEYQVIIKEYEIIIKFLHYTTSNARLDIYVTGFLSNITHSLKEVIVMPLNSSFTVSDSYKTEPPGQLTGILIQKSTTSLIPLRYYLHSNGTPNPPSFLEPEDICSNLQFRLKIESFNNKLMQLRNSLNKNYETAIGYRYTANGELEFDIQKGNIDSASVGFLPKYALDGLVHSHYIGTLPYFSYDDLFIPYQLYKQGKIRKFKTFSLGVVSTAGTMFLYFDSSQYLAWAQKNYHSNTWNASAIEYGYSYSLGVIKGGVEVGREELAKFFFKEESGIYLLDLDARGNIRRYERINSNMDTRANTCEN